MSTDTSRVLELKTALDEQKATADGILGEIVDETGDGKFVLSTEKKAALDEAMANAAEIKGLLDAQVQLDGYDTEALRDLGVAKAPESKGMASDAIDAHRERGIAELVHEAKSLGAEFVDSEEFKAFAANPHGTGEAFRLEQKDIHTASAPTVTNLGFGMTQRDPMVQYAHRSQRVRSLFPARQTTANLIEFYKVTGLTNNAAPVAERDGSDFAAKPQSGITFAADQAAVRTIAHWEAAHRNVLADEPQLRGIIDNELLYGLRLQEDYQILQGDGTDENLLGILNTPDTQEYAWSDGPETSDNRADAVRRAITKGILAYYEMTGVVLNPLDWEDIELTKDADERYLVTVGVAIGAEQRLWRLPVTDTPAMPEGTFLTGAFGLGAQLYDREAPNVRMADQHEDFFTRNAVVILAEQRLALATKRPESFVVGTFDNAPTGS